MSGVFVVVGARRGTGLEVIKRLCERPQETVKEIRAICRDAERIPPELQTTADARIRVIIADCARPETLGEAFTNAQVAFFCASAATLHNYIEVDELGVKNVAEVAKAAGVNKVVLVSSQLVHPSNYWSFVRILLNTIITGFFSAKSIMDCKYDGEQHLRKSGTPYVIIRPGQLVDGPLRSGIIIVGQTNGHFLSGAKSTRADVSDLCVAAALSVHCVNMTMECACVAPTEGLAPSINEEEIFRPLSSEWDSQFLKE
jgi:uncharacterized protein YbjT (DUF2867 family)